MFWSCCTKAVCPWRNGFSPGFWPFPLVIWAFLCKEPCNSHINSNTKKRSSKSNYLCVCIAYRRREKYLNILGGGWKSDPRFEKIFIECSFALPNPHPLLRIWSEAENYQTAPKEYAGSVLESTGAQDTTTAALCICWFPQRHGQRCSPFVFFWGRMTQLSSCQTHMVMQTWALTLQSSHSPLSEPPISLEFLQETWSSSRPKNVQKCRNSSSP